jgi:hypothetical protein
VAGFGETTPATVSVTGLIGAVTELGTEGPPEGSGADPEDELGELGVDAGVGAELVDSGAVSLVDFGGDPPEDVGAEPPLDPPDDCGEPPDEVGAQPPDGCGEEDDSPEGAFTCGTTCTPPTSSAWAAAGTASAATNATTTTVRRSLVLRARALAKGNIVDSQNPFVGHAAVLRLPSVRGNPDPRTQRTYLERLSTRREFKHRSPQKARKLRVF